MEPLNFVLSTKEAEYILTIISEGNLTKAAQKLYISQPSLSQAIQKLEKGFGVPLFLREGHRIKPTFYGSRCAEVCSRMIKLCRDMANEFDETNNINRGSVIVGMPFNLSSYIFPVLYSIYQKKYPKIKVTPVEGTSQDLESMLVSGNIDIAVITLPCKNPVLECKKIFDANMILSVPNGNRLNQYAVNKPGERHARLDIKLADREPFILSPVGQKVYGVEQDIFKYAGITPKIVFVTKNVETKKRMSAAGLGLAIFPEHYLDFYSSYSGANYYYIDCDYESHWTVGAVYRKDSFMPKATADCLSILTELFEDYHPYSPNYDALNSPIKIVPKK